MLDKSALYIGFGMNNTVGERVSDFLRDKDNGEEKHPPPPAVLGVCFFGKF